MLQVAIYKTRVPGILGDKREFMPVRDVICLILNESRSQCVAVCCSALQCVRERERLKKRESEWARERESKSVREWEPTEREREKAKDLEGGREWEREQERERDREREQEREMYTFVGNTTHIYVSWWCGYPSSACCIVRSLWWVSSVLVGLLCPWVCCRVL